jgi:hypothetical protein
MRRLFKILAIALCFCFAIGLSAPAIHAGEKTLEATWTQVLPDPNDLDKWGLWYSEDEVVWTLLTDIIYVAEQSTYTTDVVFESPDGQTKTWYFRMNSYDIAGNTEGWSNTASTTIDFDAPGEPQTFQVIIKVVPGP